MKQATVPNFIYTNYAHLNRGSVNLVDMGATYRPGIVGLYIHVK